MDKRIDEDFNQSKRMELQKESKDIKQPTVSVSEERSNEFEEESLEETSEEKRQKL